MFPVPLGITHFGGRSPREEREKFRPQIRDQGLGQADSPVRGVPPPAAALGGALQTPGPTGLLSEPHHPRPRQVLICELRAAPGSTQGWGHEVLLASEFQQALEDQSTRGAHPSPLIKGVGRGSVQGVKGTQQVL